MTNPTPAPSPTPELPRPKLISAEERSQLRLLRAHRKAHRAERLNRLPIKATVPAEHFVTPEATRGQRLADGVAATIGSWRFILLQSTAILFWITGNVWFGGGAWDPYPFILLNLLLSFQAAYTAPAIMMSQNRQSEMDRRHAETDYEINVKAELEIELLHEKIDMMKEPELMALTKAVQELTELVQVLTERQVK